MDGIRHSEEWISSGLFTGVEIDGVYLTAKCCSWKLDNWTDPVCSMNAIKCKDWTHCNREIMWAFGHFTRSVYWQIQPLDRTSHYIQGKQACVNASMPISRMRGLCLEILHLILIISNQPINLLPTRLWKKPDTSIYPGDVLQYAKKETLFNKLSRREKKY